MAKKRKKITVAGCLVREVVYTPPTIRDTGAARSAKRRVSTEAQTRANAKTSCRKLADMLATNFRKGDLVVVLTYDAPYLPHIHKTAQKCLKSFRKSVNDERAKAGLPPLKMIWNYENDHGDKRWHHHAVINATGDDYAMLQRCWPYGEVLIDPLRVDKEKNYITLAKYMCKERPDKPGQHQWSSTKNVNKPERDSFWVDADTTVQAPRGSLILESYNKRDAYGASIQYVEYLAPGWELGRASRAKRRRRRK